ncbi:CII family transcriptional regulator [Pseudomonas savastanoi]|uniref:Transcriptional regulator n=1 Tax=Pseudomonas savastanoi pv. savastanoi NCPPB 3335 TaxID=693985 RepID=A0ABC8BB08_PSESS|nr:CII family transcriptional regulator [Pseudomonas savastanoi]ARD11388.1 transcriptional regulator [Pseudomonas savastanoi pv. savastanoi NCPPB 3335]MBA4702943.1 response regulator transcription factor [Pseudomonas savastanoi pv. savastanoi]
MSTTSVSQETDETARETETLILQRVLSVGQKEIARETGLSESTVSRWNEGEYARWAKVLSFLGLRVVPQSAMLVTPAYLHSLETLAEIGLKAEKKRPGPLRWD